MNAQELMTEDPMTIRPTTVVRDALEILDTLDIRHLPVVDAGGALVGMVSDRDLRPIGAAIALASAPNERDASLELPVSKIMSSDVTALDPEAEIEEIIDLMLERKVGALPVVETASAELVGIVSYVDLLRAMRAMAE